MRQNYETCIVGQSCVLVPYRPEHVLKYHEWMTDPHLLEMTGSEPLSLQEEIDMQQSWCEDPNKCTFIVLAKDQCDFGDGIPGKPLEKDPDFCQRNLPAMVGDVNLFFSQEENEDEEDTFEKEKDSSWKQAELDIMIAETGYRGKGLGKEACRLMMMYGTKAMTIRRFFCKIKEENESSLGLFKNRLGFEQCGYAACFKEVELEYKRSSDAQVHEEIGSSLAMEYSCSKRKDAPSPVEIFVMSFQEEYLFVSSLI